MDLPHLFVVRINLFELRARRDHFDVVLEHLVDIGQVALGRLFNPSFNGIRYNVDVTILLGSFQHLLGSQIQFIESLDEVLRQLEVCVLDHELVLLEDACTQNSIVPIKDGESLIFVIHSTHYV